MVKSGTVLRALSSFFYVQIDNEVIECRASKKLKINQKIIVGDNVQVDLEENYITLINPRTSELKRPLIANVSNAFIVLSVKEPKLDFNLLDKMITLMEYNKLKLNIIITKVDLLNQEELKEIKSKLNYYEQIGYNILYSSIDSDIKQITSLLENDRYVITGQSGVGKSTLLNRIIPDLNLQTQNISNALGRGKHTTREVTFYAYKDSYLIDTPGFSSLDLDMEPEEVRDNFVDFYSLSKDCKFSTCFHDQEPGCNVKNNLENILETRYKNYLNLLSKSKDGKWKKY
ncbi:MAG: ribosome small subunit-dependent GTPase A [Mycoplasmatales bacterium]